MNNQSKQSSLLNQLLELSELEEIGKQYFQITGKNIDYSQCIMLLRQPRLKTTLEELQTPFQRDEQKKVRQSFHEAYGQTGLTDADFINENHSIEIEKSLRYVSIPAHHHTFIECVYVLIGECTHTISNNVYHQKQGCFTIIPPDITHELYINPDCICLTIKIRTDTFVRWQLPNLPYFSLPFCFNCGDDSFITELLLQMYFQQKQEASYYAEIVSLLFQAFLIYCMQTYRDTMQFLLICTPLHGKMLEIVNYAFENYQSITLKGLAQHFHYSESYLCRLFRENSDSSFTQIVKTYRLMRATEFLKKNMKLNAVCDAIGYKDVTQFIRDFKKQYQITPAKYRKQAK